jgi:hypothetical protein
VHLHTTCTRALTFSEIYQSTTSFTTSLASTPRTLSLHQAIEITYSPLSEAHIGNINVNTCVELFQSPPHHQHQQQSISLQQQSPNVRQGFIKTLLSRQQLDKDRRRVADMIAKANLQQGGESGGESKISEKNMLNKSLEEDDVNCESCAADRHIQNINNAVDAQSLPHLTLDDLGLTLDDFGDMDLSPPAAPPTSGNCESADLPSMLPTHIAAEGPVHVVVARSQSSPSSPNTRGTCHTPPHPELLSFWSICNICILYVYVYMSTPIPLPIMYMTHRLLQILAPTLML